MKLRKLAPLFLIAALGGCSSDDWDHALYYTGIADAPAQQPAQTASGQDAAPQPAVASAPRASSPDAAQPWTPAGTGPDSTQTTTAAPPQTVVSAPQAQPRQDNSAAAPAAADSWCQEVAQSTVADASNLGFDAATQHRRAETAYNQCVRYEH